MRTIGSLKICVVGRWKATCGVSLHAELLVTGLTSLGASVSVFAPTIESASRDWHHKLLGKDEPWVKRVYEETLDYRYPYGGGFSVEPILEEGCDALIVETYEKFPMIEFSKKASLFKKMPVIAVVHQAYVRDVAPLLRVDWNAITVFDDRYRRELFSVFGDQVLEKIRIIPYPYLTLDLSSIKPCRPEEAGDTTLFITYGRQPISEYSDYHAALRDLWERGFRFKWWIIRSNGPTPFDEEWVIEWSRRPGVRELYSYVMASDIHLLPKGDCRGVVVSSTLAQILYSGTPTVVPDTRYFETIPVDHRGLGPVVKYRPGDTIDLERKLYILLRDENARQRVSREAREYAEKNSYIKVAKAYLELIEELLERKT